MDNSSLYTVNGVAESDYVAKKSDELSFTKGAIILNIKEQPGGWWEGTLNGKTGLFPDSYVKLLTDSGVVLRDKSATSNRRCKAVYSYTRNNDDELTLAVGDIIEFLEEVEEGWWKGKLKNNIGVFPSNFVTDIEPAQPVIGFERITQQHKETQMKKNLSSSKENLLSANMISEKDAPILPPKPVREICKVLFPYDPANEDELELIPGDIISILSKDLPDVGWWKGELKGKVGLFPDNFVQIVPYDASPSKDSTNSKPDRPPISSKILINKTQNSTNNQRKDSFGSKDSLNETGNIIVPTGNVASHRKSLENRIVTVDGGLIEKSARKSIESKLNSELRKSLENLDENRKSTPPPVLTKKPVVPIKKSPTIGSVFSGFKQKSKSNVESKTISQDNFDGVSSSKLNSHIPDNLEKGIIGERIKKDDSEFDTVERGHILQDMRAGRAKAPKRRPPSAAVSISGDGINYMNGNTHVSDNLSESPPIITHSVDEEIAKPKPREWEKHKAPWMDELKASQMRKTSPNANESKSPEPHKTNETAGSVEHTVDHNKINESIKQVHNSYSVSHRKSSNETNAFEIRSSSVDVKTSYEKRDIESSMTKSMSSALGGTNILNNNAAKPPIDNTVNDDKPTSRPLSVNLRNRSISPISRGVKSIHAAASVDLSKLSNNDSPITQDNVCSRVTELEQRVIKLERIVQSQVATIDDLVKTLKDEKDKMKVLKTELDKYAQCVTQV